MRVDDVFEWSSKAKTVFERLQDDESKDLFLWRISYMFGGEFAAQEHVWDIIKRYNDWSIPEILKEHTIIIYGSGKRGIPQYRLLKHWGLDCVCFCETNPNGKDTVDGLKVVSVEYAVNEYPDAIFIISSTFYKHEMLEKLRMLNVEDDRIISFRLPLPCYNRGLQYFDVFSPLDREYFCGCRYI